MKRLSYFVLLALIFLSSCTNNKVLDTATTPTPYNTPTPTYTPSSTATSSATATATVVAVLPSTDERLLAFALTTGNNSDIYTMHLDGSELTNLTNSPEHESNPFWSPDGTRIAFESDPDVFPQIFVMNADGSGVIPLTDGEKIDILQFDLPITTPWSPDGTRLFFTEIDPNPEGPVGVETGYLELYSIDADGQNKTFLANMVDIGNRPSWSPDSKRVAFITGGEMAVLRIHVADASGNGVTDITKRLQPDESSGGYAWSPDGQSITFIAAPTWGEENSIYTVYEASLAGKTLTEKATFSTPVDSWHDGTALDTDESTLTWLHADGTSNTFQPLVNCQSASASSATFRTQRSASGNLLISVNCPNYDLWFYWADADGEVVKQLIDSPVSAKEGERNFISWSPDEKYAVITVASPTVSYLYVMNIDESLNNPSIQPLQIVLPGSKLRPGISWQPVP